jgi:aminodeoxyfutalosine synthase
MAGSEEQTPSLSTAQLVTLIRQVGREPVERDTLYNEIRNFKDIDPNMISMDASLN